MSRIFRDRGEAGRDLARRLLGYAGRPDVLVVGLARGGVPVASEIARELGVPVDLLVVRKIGAPGQEELALGAVSADGVVVENEDVLRGLGVSRHTFDAAAAREQVEAQRRERLYRGDRAALDVRGRTVILADDGIATGATARAGVLALRRGGAVRIVVAAPVASLPAAEVLGTLADDCVFGVTPALFGAVGLWYRDFAPVPTEEIQDLLVGAAPPATNAGRSRLT